MKTNEMLAREHEARFAEGMAALRADQTPEQRDAQDWATMSPADREKIVSAAERVADGAQGFPGWESVEYDGPELYGIPVAETEPPAGLYFGPAGLRYALPIISDLPNDLILCCRP